MTNEKSLHPKPILAIGDQEVIYTELNSQRSKSFASWHAIKNDMRFVINAFTLIITYLEKTSLCKKTYIFCSEDEKQDTESILQIALYRSAVVTYVKAFVTSKGRIHTLNQDIFKNNLKEIHKELFDERHNYHAHLGVSIYEKLIPIIAFARGKKSINLLSTLSFNMICKNVDKIKDYINLAKYVYDYVDRKANECGQEVYKEVEPKIDAFYNKAEKNNKA